MLKNIKFDLGNKFTRKIEKNEKRLQVHSSFAKKN